MTPQSGILTQAQINELVFDRYPEPRVLAGPDQEEQEWLDEHRRQYEHELGLHNVAIIPQNI